MCIGRKRGTIDGNNRDLLTATFLVEISLLGTTLRVIVFGRPKCQLIGTSTDRLVISNKYVTFL